MRVTLLSALLVAAPFAAAAPAPDTYSLKLSFKPGAGTSYVVKDSSKTNGSVVISDASGAALNKEAIGDETEEVYIETVLEKGDKKPAKFKRAYEKAGKTAAAKKAKETRPYQGRTVVFTLKDGKYEVAAEGGPALDGAVLKELADKANGNDDADDILTPKKPVKVGETWKVDPKAMAKSFDKDGTSVLDADKSKGEGKLVKVYTKGGKQYGVVELGITIAIKKTGKDGAELTFDKPAVMEMKVTLDVVIDGSDGAGTMTMTGKMSGRGAVTAGDQKFTVDMNLEMSGKKEQSAAKHGPAREEK